MRSLATTRPSCGVCTSAAIRLRSEYLEAWQQGVRRGEGGRSIGKRQLVPDKVHVGLNGLALPDILSLHREHGPSAAGSRRELVA